MITIYECTDCKHCADFSDGWRVVCLHPTCIPEKVCDYEPVGEKDAQDCEGFEEYLTYNPNRKFSMKQFDEAEKSFPDDYNWYKGIREWCLENEKKQ
jgi:hypothetical protein